MNGSENQVSGASRRDFLKGLGGGLALGLAAASPRGLGAIAPSDRIQMGFIGVGGQGTAEGIHGARRRGRSSHLRCG